MDASLFRLEAKIIHDLFCVCLVEAAQSQNKMGEATLNVEEVTIRSKYTVRFHYPEAETMHKEKLVSPCK